MVVLWFALLGVRLPQKIGPGCTKSCRSRVSQFLIPGNNSCLLTTVVKLIPFPLFIFFKQVEALVAYWGLTLVSMLYFCFLVRLQVYNNLANSSLSGTPFYVINMESMFYCTYCTTQWSRCLIRKANA